MPSSNRTIESKRVGGKSPKDRDAPTGKTGGGRKKTASEEDREKKGNGANYGNKTRERNESHEVEKGIIGTVDRKKKKRCRPVGVHEKNAGGEMDTGSVLP